jgi:uncharacterized membrane protein
VHLLFWLSLVPFVTGWMGENHFAPLPVALYGFVLLMCGVAFTVLAQLLVRADGLVLWANLHLLFWLSLFPFTTAWLDDSHVAQVPTVVYGLNLLAAALAYYLLQLAIFRTPSGGRLRTALGRDWKGRLSPVFYLAGIGLAYVEPWAAEVPYVLVALIWLVPDRRVERYLQSERAV